MPIPFTCRKPAVTIPLVVRIENLGGTRLLFGDVIGDPKRTAVPIEDCVRLPDRAEWEYDLARVIPEGAITWPDTGAYRIWIRFPVFDEQGRKKFEIDDEFPVRVGG